VRQRLVLLPMVTIWRLIAGLRVGICGCSKIFEGNKENPESCNSMLV
jgi:hypothetical protein